MKHKLEILIKRDREIFLSAKSYLKPQVVDVVGSKYKDFHSNHLVLFSTFQPVVNQVQETYQPASEQRARKIPLCCG